MVQIIAGKKGKGKTKYLLDMANNAVKESKGSIVYLDKSSKHMYELSNKIRLINVAEFPVHSAEAFVGFICGIISQDHDLEVMYLDSFLKPKRYLSLAQQDIIQLHDLHKLIMFQLKIQLHTFHFHELLVQVMASENYA